MRIPTEGPEMKNDRKLETPPKVQGSANAAGSDDARVEARRRFLRIGAGGSAALVVTVMHRRAFASAGIKKNVIASACTSLQGVPDLQNTKSKRALETSAMGTPKGLICRPKQAGLAPGQLPPNLCAPGPYKNAQYRNQYGVVQRYNDYSKLNDGCGAIEHTANMNPLTFETGSGSYRLYEKGWCPIKYDSSGLNYDTSAKYYTPPKPGTDVWVPNACKFQ